MIYFLADTHFGDDNIRRYENRPFDNVEDMNNCLVNNWNRVVSEEDEVYLIGDFASNGYENVLTKLNGSKYLIKGNHDTESNEFYRNVGFVEVYDKPVILNEFWILSHEPLYVNENMPYANIFGHIHNSPLFKTFSKQHYCVSVERLDYSPISFEQVKKKIQEAN